MVKGLHFWNQMATKRKTRKCSSRKRSSGKKRKNVQRGGASPFFVDFKKGVEVTKDLVKAIKKTDMKKAKQQYKRMQQEHKRSGSSKSIGNWAIEKGYAKRSGCCIM